MQAVPGEKKERENRKNVFTTPLSGSCNIYLFKTIYSSPPMYEAVLGPSITVMKQIDQLPALLKLTL